MDYQWDPALGPEVVALSVAFAQYLRISTLGPDDSGTPWLMAGGNGATTLDLGAKEGGGIIFGADGGDTLTGSSLAAFWLVGGKGDDTLTGRGVDDALFGGAGKIACSAATAPTA